MDFRRLSRAHAKKRSKSPAWSSASADTYATASRRSAPNSPPAPLGQGLRPAPLPRPVPPPSRPGRSRRKPGCARISTRIRGRGGDPTQVADPLQFTQTRRHRTSDAHGARPCGPRTTQSRRASRRRPKNVRTPKPPKPKLRPKRRNPSRSQRPQRRQLRIRRISRTGWIWRPCDA